MNWGMIGHEWAVRLLRGQIENDGLRHAYLFTGPRGIGRRTLAIRLAQALCCENPPLPGESCQTCRTCKQIERMQHPDLLVVQAEQMGGILKVDQVRELQRGLALSPYQSPYKIALLLRFEETNPNAANALLKTLEEPAERVVLVLTAESEELLLPTIVSRCEVIRLRPVPIQPLKQALQERWDIPENQAELLAHISSGRPGYALSLSHDSKGMEERQEWLELLLELISSNRVKRFSSADRLAKSKSATNGSLTVWLSFWRDVLFRASGSSVPIANVDRSAEIDLLAEQLGFSAARDAVVDIERIMDLLGRNINPRLAFEVLMLDLPEVPTV